MCFLPCGLVPVYLLCVVIRAFYCNLPLNGILNGVLKAGGCMLNHNIYFMTN